MHATGGTGDAHARPARRLTGITSELCPTNLADVTRVMRVACWTKPFCDFAWVSVRTHSPKQGTN